MWQASEGIFVILAIIAVISLFSGGSRPRRSRRELGEFPPHNITARNQGESVRAALGTLPESPFIPDANKDIPNVASRAARGKDSK